MVLSLFALGAEVTPAVKESQVAIENAFKQIFDEQYSFKNFTSEEVFMNELSSAVSTDSIIVAGAESAYFKAFKNFVCSAFNLKCKPSKTVVNLIQLVHPELMDDEIAEHANMPSSAVPLPTQDGLCSGFGLKAKKQLLIVLPLDDGRIDYVVNNSLIKFVRENMDLSILANDDPLAGMAEDTSIVTRKETRKDGELYNRQLIKNCVKAFDSRGLTVSIANTKTVDFINNISTNDIDLSCIMGISDYSVEKGEMSARDYAVNLAQGAFTCSVCDVGGAVTKVFAIPDENGVQNYFMYACIADKENVNVAKLTAEADETPPQLIYRAVDELFRMLIVWAEMGNENSQNATVSKRTRADKGNSKLKIMKIIIGAMVALSSIASLIISFVANNIYGIL